MKRLALLLPLLLSLPLKTVRQWGQSLLPPTQMGGIPLLTPYRELMQLSLILMLPAVFSALRLLPILKCQVVQREPMPIPSQSPLLMVVG